MGNAEAVQRLGDLEVDRSREEVHEDWNVSSGKLRGTAVTVFSAVHPTSSRKRPFMEKALQASKIYRHPSILRYLDGGLFDKEIIVVTEQASPLLVHGLENMSLLQITAGLASIIEALIFLHDKAGVSHNNVVASNIYVTSEGVWKLWGLEFSCSFGALTRDHIERVNQYCNEKSLPPDEKSRIAPSYQHARDCYFLGRFIEDTITPFLDTDEPGVAEFVKFIHEKGLHAEWGERPRLSAFLEHDLFRHEFLQLRHDVANVLLLQVEQRDQFLRSLPTALKGYPDQLVASTLSSLLLTHSFLLIPSSATHLMPCLLTPKTDDSDTGLFSTAVFKETVIPLIVQLFSIHDATIRKVLLIHFEHYVHLFEKEQLTAYILPQVLLGIRDTDEDLVERTLHALACLIPHLGADVVVGRNREQIFATAKPKVINTKLKKGVFRTSETKAKKPKVTDLTSPVALNPIEKETLQSPREESHPIVMDDESRGMENIPERSSPDGGETTDDEGNPLFLLRKGKEGGDTWEPPPEEKEWSDWEEMLDTPPTPDIIGVLEVKPLETDVVGVSDGTSLEGPPFESGSQPKPSLGDGRKAIRAVPNDSAKGSAMQLKNQSSNAVKKTSKTQGLGEEYDIMSIKVEKKHDSELDLFADLAPSLPTKDFNLETMLMEASHKTRSPKHPSLSDTLAELDVAGVEEGDDWNEEMQWTNSEDLPSLGPSKTKEVASLALED